MRTLLARQADRELASRTDRIDGPCHRQHAAIMLAHIELCGHGPAGTSRSIALRASRLHDESRDDSVEHQSLEESAGCEPREVCNMLRRRIAPRSDLNLAERRAQHKSHRELPCHRAAQDRPSDCEGCASTATKPLDVSGADPAATIDRLRADRQDVVASIADGHIARQEHMDRQ